jgi:hypothetical protein
MLRIDQAADPAVHKLCCNLATRLLLLIKPRLRFHESDRVMEALYSICREEIDKPARLEEV